MPHNQNHSTHTPVKSNEDNAFMEAYEQLLKTTFTKDEIENFYSHFKPLVAQTLPQLH